ncbi:MAG: hypothetical protein ABI045_05385 [Flavobacteriales bacterium]
MRCVVERAQEVSVSHYVCKRSKLDGEYSGVEKKIPGKLLGYYRHTFGLNHLNLELTR